MQVKNFYLTNDIIYRLSAEAKRKGVTEAEIVRQSLAAVLPELKGGPPAEPEKPYTQSMSIPFRGTDVSLTKLAKHLGISTAYLSVYYKQGKIPNVLKRYAHVPKPPLTTSEVNQLAAAVDTAYKEKLLGD